MSNGLGVRKLPVWRTVKAAYLVLFHNPKLAIKLSLIPMALAILPLLIEAYLWSGMTLEELVQTQEAEGRAFFFLVWVLPIIQFLSMVPMITAWHRLVLLGHDHPEARIRYSISRTEWSYLGKGILFTLVLGLFMVVAIVIPTVIGAAFGSALQGAHIAIVFLALFAMLPVYAFIFRVSPVFPAAAIGEPLGFRESWRLTRGNTWRIFTTFILAALPTVIIMKLVGVIFEGMFVLDPSAGAFPDFNDQLIVSAIHVPLWIISACVGISVWSWCYRFFVQKQPITLPGE